MIVLCMMWRHEPASHSIIDLPELSEALNQKGRLNRRMIASEALSRFKRLLFSTECFPFAKAPPPDRLLDSSRGSSTGWGKWVNFNVLHLLLWTSFALQYAFHCRCIAHWAMGIWNSEYQRSVVIIKNNMHVDINSMMQKKAKSPLEAKAKIDCSTSFHDPWNSFPNRYEFFERVAINFDKSFSQWHIVKSVSFLTWNLSVVEWYSSCGSSSFYWELFS